MGMNEIESPALEKRRGNTGVWTFILETPDGKILAAAEWGTNYEFEKAQWLALPVVNL